MMFAATLVMAATLLVGGVSAQPAHPPPFGTPWFRSDSSRVNFTYPVDEGHQAVWWTKPVKPTVALTYLPSPLDISSPGKSAVISLLWKSSGKNDCDPFDWADNKTCSCDQKIKETCEKGKGTPKCAKISVNCIEGTGDFRIAVWDTITNKAPRETTDNFCPGCGGDPMHSYMDRNFQKFRGYHWRTMPHVSQVYHHPKDSEPGGIYGKVNSPDPFDDHRLEKFAGFAIPHDTWVPFVLNITRKEEFEYELSISMGAVEYSFTHVWNSTDAADMPQVIDSFGFWFPNSRDYSYIALAAGA